MRYTLRLTETQHQKLRAHLYPGDASEAVALALCGRRSGPDREAWMVRDIRAIPYEACVERTADHVVWSTELLADVLPEAARRGFAVLKIHSHPLGIERFSERDDRCDADVFAAVSNWLNSGLRHASAVMLPDGRIFGRAVCTGQPPEPIASVLCVGDDLRVWYPPGSGAESEAFTQRHAQAFGKGTAALLRQLSVGVVGCSGTGSIVVEQLARLGVGRFVLVDPGRVEERNLNRILNSGHEDAYLQRYKVHVLASAIARMGFGQEVMPLTVNVLSREAVEALGGCDIVFGCVDSAEGRHLLNRLSAFYTLPYFDVGVQLEADGNGGIRQIAGQVQYYHPGEASLLDRRAYTMERVRAEGYRRTAPELYQEQRGEGYLHGVEEDRPAVISVNMLYASLMVNDLLARLHPYRNGPNRACNYLGVNLSEPMFCPETPDLGDDGVRLAQYTGRGDMDPLLDYPYLS